jgi:hypothetical protein
MTGYQLTAEDRDGIWMSTAIAISPQAAMTIPQGRPWEFPTDGHGLSPGMVIKFPGDGHVSPHR